MADDDAECDPAAEGPTGGVTEILARPELADAAGVWRVARDSGTLDLNSSYTYLLWCRDFADTSVVARSAAGVAGFVTGYLRPAAPDTVVVWQVAVHGQHRGRGLAGAMLDHLAARLIPRGIRGLEATVTPDNEASARLFTAFAGRHGAPLNRRELFGAALFPDVHEPEILFRIGPLA